MRTSNVQGKFPSNIFAVCSSHRTKQMLHDAARSEVSRLWRLPKIQRSQPIGLLVSLNVGMKERANLIAAPEAHSAVMQSCCHGTVTQ
jgi:hypothetical protein